MSQTRHPIFRYGGKLALSPLGQAILHRLSAFRNYHGWPRSIISEVGGETALRQALETGPYGRCVYHCDNDVVDHQAVMMSFGPDVSVTLTMHGHSNREGRTLRIDGTLGTLAARMSLFESEVTINYKRAGKTKRIYIPHLSLDGHGGGDFGLMKAFHQALRYGNAQPLTSARASLESHLLAFAAEKARLTGQTIDMAAYRREAWAAL
jgi:hypothetical protein